MTRSRADITNSFFLFFFLATLSLDGYMPPSSLHLPCRLLSFTWFVSLIYLIWLPFVVQEFHPPPPRFSVCTVFYVFHNIPISSDCHGFHCNPNAGDWRLLWPALTFDWASDHSFSSTVRKLPLYLLPLTKGCPSLCLFPHTDSFQIRIL